METLNEYVKTEYELAKEDELSAHLIGVAKGCPVKYRSTPTEKGGYQLRSFGGGYIGVIVDHQGEMLKALQMDEAWVAYIDESMPTEADLDNLINCMIELADKCQHLFIEPDPALLDFPKVTPMISDGTDGSEAGVDHRLIKATFDAEKVLYADSSTTDARQAAIYKTTDRGLPGGEGYFIGEIRRNDLDGVEKITYINPVDAEAVLAKAAEIQAEADRRNAKDDDYMLEHDYLLPLVIGAIEKASTEKHPTTPWDLIPNEVFWRRSCHYW